MREPDVTGVHAQGLRTSMRTNTHPAGRKDGLLQLLYLGCTDLVIVQLFHSMSSSSIYLYARFA